MFMKKNEKIKGNYMVFAVFSINFVFGTAFGIFLLILKNRPFLKSAY